jgi:hypothetical protein
MADDDQGFGNCRETRNRNKYAQFRRKTPRDSRAGDNIRIIAPQPPEI